MRYTQLGSSGLTVSVLGVGCNAFGSRIGADAVGDVVDAALAEGVNFFDTSDSYGSGASEELLGKALGPRRADTVIATKFGSDLDGANGADWGVRGSRRYIKRAVEASLRRLGTEWIDLYQLHWPDPHTPIQETLAALDDLVSEGKVRYVGSSNLPAWQVVDADWTARTRGYTPFVSAQNKYSLYDRSADKALVPALAHLGVSLLPYFPLEFGLLTGKYRRGEAAPVDSRLAQQTQRLAAADFDRIEAIGSYAQERGQRMLDVAIGGLAAQPQVGSVIAGATSGEQVRANAAATTWMPTPEDLADLDAVTAAHHGQG